MPLKLISIVVLLVGVVFDSLVGARAQTPSSTTSRQFDGAYAFVSAAKENETYTDQAGIMKYCPDYKGGQLTIANGQVHYRDFEGTLSPKGELTLRASPQEIGGLQMINGSIDSNGTIHARRMTYYCGYDLVWKKVSK